MSWSCNGSPSFKLTQDIKDYTKYTLDSERPKTDADTAWVTSYMTGDKLIITFFMKMMIVSVIVYDFEIEIVW